MNYSQYPKIDRKVFSKSMRKIMGMTNPIGKDCTQYLQRSKSGLNQRRLNLPALTVSALALRKTTKNNTSTPISRQLSDKSLEDKVERLRSTNQSSGSKLSMISRREEAQPQESMARHVDDIMNAVIATHSPQLSGNSAIKRSISTKKFRNVRVMTDTEEPSPGGGLRTSLLIKEILNFMMKHSQENYLHKKALREDPEIYNQDLSKFSPIKLVKKSEEMLGLYPLHEFKREEDLCQQPLNSETYIKQLRTSKLDVKDLQLKRH